MGVAFGLAACLAAAAAALPVPPPPGPAATGPADVAERDGAILYYTPEGRECALTPEGRFTQPALSPDGTTAAFVHIETEGDPGTDTARTSLWIADVASGTRRMLVASKPAAAMTETLGAMWKPEFSLNGGFVYVMAEAWVTSPAIHQVNLATGAHRFVIDGELLFVIRTGRYAGYLAVRRHRYRGAPDPVAYDAAYIVRPDGKWVHEVPGSADDDDDAALAAWMRRNGGAR